MRIEVLGCGGGVAPGCRPTCLLINDTIALDAGALAEGLSLARQREVRSVVLTHAHVDHTLSLPFLVENVIGRKSGAVDVHASGSTIASVRQHLFNGVVWPDFTRIPDRRSPALIFRELFEGEARQIDEVVFTPIPVNHSVETFGFLVESRGRSILWSSDTGPTEELWRVANRATGLQAVFIETSFSNAEQPLADLSRHLTPVTLERELQQLERHVPVLVHHLKPASAEAIRREIESLDRSDLEVLREGEIHTF